jgi:glycosyltransferase involved in cell wall biosynthesis
MTPSASGVPADGPRILVLTRQLPHPPVGGIMLREINLVRALAATGPTAVFGLAPAGPPPEQVALAAWEASSDPGAGDHRHGDDLMDAIRRGDSPFTLPCSSVAASELEQRLATFAPDLVVIRGSELAAYLPIMAAAADVVVVDADASLTSTVRRMGERDPNRARGLTWRYASGLVAPAERAVLDAVDQVWVSSEIERRFLLELFPESAPVRVVPNVVDVDRAPARRPEPGRLLYIGRYDYWPNDEAAAELVRDILPQLPDATLSLVGMAPTPWMQALDTPGVEVTGTVDDVRPYLAAAACVVIPLRAGTGTRLKVLEAGAAHVPVVSTELGVEGIAFAAGEHYLAAETVADFVAAVRQLHDDPALVNRITGAAHQIVTEQYSVAALTTQVAAAIRAV